MNENFQKSSPFRLKTQINSYDTILKGDTWGVTCVSKGGTSSWKVTLWYFPSRTSVHRIFEMNMNNIFLYLVKMFSDVWLQKFLKVRKFYWETDVNENFQKASPFWIKNQIIRYYTILKGDTRGVTFVSKGDTSS